mmetsp:Transcript_331/g.678  ORF Transcript_331/g.678 Transcript_331/m.678 type:complete len:818 (-) Transcript_331:253-2706(-)|eukprot:CAMPEP_0171572810 /NCGR_PEP_ID=MMETSP0961-20121227/4371_1 /TAXON_ID=87120 /ORGANISM="Aurantiochytrium limacinum, Strain ATCCMYA-1381" /LENGTH=817 /DNA_ID=CAMNT_0012127781 /DNA_START=346 /DNA_END=2799 /DNA_ORIENTATION=-
MSKRVDAPRDLPGSPRLALSAITGTGDSTSSSSSPSSSCDLKSEISLHIKMTSTESATGIATAPGDNLQERVEDKAKAATKPKLATTRGFSLSAPAPSTTIIYNVDPAPEKIEREDLEKVNEDLSKRNTASTKKHPARTTSAKKPTKAKTTSTAPRRRAAPRKTSTTASTMAALNSTAAGSRRTSTRTRPPKRRRNETMQVLDPTLFVGYVEEYETPEMIEAKFKRLEEIEARLKRDREASQNQQSSQSNDPSNANQHQESSTAITTNAAGDAAVSPIENSNCAEGDVVKTNAEGAEATPEGQSKPMEEENVLDRAALLEVFRQTSNFTVEAATRQHKMGDDYYYDDDGWEMGHVTTHENESGERVFLFGDGTDDELWDELFGKKKQARVRAPRLAMPSNRTTSVSKIVANGVTHIAFVADKSGRFVTGLKKIRMFDPNAIMYTRIPREITPSWAKRIAPYRPKSAVHRHTTWRPDEVCIDEDNFTMKAEVPKCSKHAQVDCILNADLLSIVGNRAPLEGIVLSPPWKDGRKLVCDSEEPNPNNIPSGIEPEDLLKLKLNRKGLLPSGFVYIWTPKHLILRVLRALEKMDLHYVENAVCVKQHVHNDFYCESSPYIRQSKDTLLICRKGRKNKSGKITWEKVEIRHQRTSDVHFEFLRRENADGGPHLYAHNYVHNMVETMLPHARFNPVAAEPPAPPKATGEAASRKKVKIRMEEDLDDNDEDANAAAAEEAAMAEDQQDGVSTASGDASASNSPRPAGTSATDNAMQDSDGSTSKTEGDKDESFAGVGPGKLLHLWAPSGRQRTGWITVSENIKP